MDANLLVGVRGPLPHKSSVLTANTECFVGIEVSSGVALNVDVQIAIVNVA